MSYINDYYKCAYRKEPEFHRPENFDKIKDLGNGKELWAGGNDWEDGWSAAAIFKKDANSEADSPTSFLEVDHSKCPGCKGTLECYSNKDCYDFAKKQVMKWAKSQD